MSLSLWGGCDPYVEIVKVSQHSASASADICTFNKSVSTRVDNRSFLSSSVLGDDGTKTNPRRYPRLIPKIHPAFGDYSSFIILKPIFA